MLSPFLDPLKKWSFHRFQPWEIHRGPIEHSQVPDTAAAADKAASSSDSSSSTSSSSSLGEGDGACLNLNGTFCSWGGWFVVRTRKHKLWSEGSRVYEAIVVLWWLILGKFWEKLHFRGTWFEFGRESLPTQQHTFRVAVLVGGRQPPFKIIHGKKVFGYGLVEFYIGPRMKHYETLATLLVIM